MTLFDRESSGPLADAIGRAGWTALLPAHRADGNDQPAGRPTCRDVLPLSAEIAVAVVEDVSGRTYPVPLVTPGDEVRRARPGDGAAQALIAALAEGSHDQGDFRLTVWHHRPAEGEREITVDQTNESVIVGDAAVVKWNVLADEGPHPAPAMLADLDRAGFLGTPLPWGALEWRPAPGAPPRLLALVVDYLPGAVDGWTWLVDDLRDAAGRDDLTQVSETGRRVGALVASFHCALAATARPATNDEALALRTSALHDLARALDVTHGATHDLLLSHVASVRAVFDSIPDIGGDPVLRVHGDLHIGQVLRVSDTSAPTYVLTDFDGNPVVPVADRLREQPAALDVAAMAQSMVHAGLVVQRHHPDLDPASVSRAADAAAHAFLTAYRHGLGVHGHLLDEQLLAAFALRQVCREFTYAATHLPRWSYVPEAALPLLLRKDQA